MDEVSKKLRNRLITTLLENDIVTAENYSTNGSSNGSEKKVNVLSIKTFKI